MTDNLSISQDGPVRRITLARPTHRNALSRSLVASLHDAFASVDEGGGTRVVVLAGEGAVFCAGGDIAEFAEAAESGRSRADAEGLANLLAAMVACPVPVVVRVQGAAYGGGVGLIAAADIAIAAEGTRFSLTEARLGLVSAVISPYVVAALGWREAKARMLLGTPFGVDQALQSGLIHQFVIPEKLDGAVQETVGDLLRGAPGAHAAIKCLPYGAWDPETTREAMTNLLVERLASDEGQEGLRAFLEKRTPAWAPVKGDA